MNELQRKAKEVGVHLSDDVASGKRFTEFPKLKRDWHWCPRCKEKRVNRIYRRCDACGGRLLWGFDDAKHFDEEYIHYYRWHTFLSGVTGWVDASYFKEKHNELKY